MTIEAKREAIARIIIGPRNPVPEGSKFTLRDAQDARWRMCTKQEQDEALWIADAILAIVEPPEPSEERAREVLADTLDRTSCFTTADNQWVERQAVIRAMIRFAREITPAT